MLSGFGRPQSLLYRWHVRSRTSDLKDADIREKTIGCLPFGDLISSVKEPLDTVPIASEKKQGLIMMPIIRRARPRGDNRGHRNFGIVIDGERMAWFAIAVLACAMLTSPMR
jgi:hypothetical protein